MTAAIKAQLAAYAKTKPTAPRKPAPHTSVPQPATDGTSRTYEATAGTVAPQGPPGFGTIVVEGFTGARFVAVGCPPPLVEALAAVCRQHGARELATNHFILESTPGSGPKVKVKSSE